MTQRVTITETELRELYYQQGLNQDQIAQRLGVSQTTVWRRMADFGLLARPSRLAAPEHLVPPRILENWTPPLAYVVGLVTTDGCLKSDQPKVVDFSSTDQVLIDLYQCCLGIAAHVISVRQRTGRQLLSVKVSDAAYRGFLTDVGLKPNKSCILGALNIPVAVFPDFLRGCVDGDGSIWITQRQGRPLFGIQIASGSEAFFAWLQDTVARLTRIVSHIYRRERRWDLRFNACYADALAEWMYYTSDVPHLPRKRAVWEKYRLMVASQERKASSAMDKD
jgi:hypothetical protein